MIEKILLSSFIPLEDDKGDDMNQKIHFIETFARVDKLNQALHVAGNAWVQLRTFLILQRV